MCNTILIVDDSKHIQKQIEVFLKSGGYSNLLFADTAQKAFELLGMEPAGNASNSVDLILMDIKLPEMDGVEACRRIKSVEQLKDIPIIMVTAEDANEVLQLAFDARAIDYIKKPINKVELIVRVGSVLKIKQEIDEQIKREKELLKLTELLEETNQKLQQANEMLRQISRTDVLTGIANRRHFEDLSRNEWKRACRLSRPVSVVLMDIDFFKNYNDTYGHQRGDDCLKQVAVALSRALKRPSDMIARYGGEEFVAFLMDTDKNGAIMVAETMQSYVNSLNIPHKSSPVSDRVTVSFGIATVVPEVHSSPEALIANADMALYKAKQEGRNRIRL
jgi:diguanylate cyclase (GGDEF)-like protein